VETTYTVGKDKGKKAGELIITGVYRMTGCIPCLVPFCRRTRKPFPAGAIDNVLVSRRQRRSVQKIAPRYKKKAPRYGNDNLQGDGAQGRKRLPTRGFSVRKAIN